MQVIPMSAAELSQAIAEGTVLSTIAGPGTSTTYVLEWNKQDLIVFADGGCGDALAVYPCSTFDQELGGSVHDEARAICRDADVDGH